MSPGDGRNLTVLREPVRRICPVGNSVRLTGFGKFPQFQSPCKAEVVVYTPPFRVRGVNAASVAQRQSSGFVNRRLWVRLPPLALSRSPLVATPNGDGNDGGVPERPMGPDCKSGGNAFAGSNPAAPTTLWQSCLRSGVEALKIRCGLDFSSADGGSRDARSDAPVVPTIAGVAQW